MAKTQNPEPTTIEKITGMLETLTPVETYLQNRVKLSEAFDALNDRKAQAESERKEVLQKAGAREADNLMGNVNLEDEQTVDGDFTHLRDQEDKLRATEDALTTQQKELDGQYDQYETNLRVSSGAISDLLLKELEGELEQVDKQVSHILNRLYIVGKVKNIRDVACANMVQKIRVPSLFSGKNYARPPFRLHPRDFSLMDEVWRDDPIAMQLYQLLEPLAITQRKMHITGRELESARQRRLDEERAA